MQPSTSQCLRRGGRIVPVSLHEGGAAHTDLSQLPLTGNAASRIQDDYLQAVQGGSQGYQGTSTIIARLHRFRKTPHLNGLATDVIYMEFITRYGEGDGKGRLGQAVDRVGNLGLQPVGLARVHQALQYLVVNRLGPVQGQAK